MVNRLQNNLVPRLLSYPSLGERESGRVGEGPGNEFAHEMGQSITEAPVSSPVFTALLKKPSNASFCTVQVLAAISYLGEYAVHFFFKIQ